MQIKTCNQINRLLSEEKWLDAGALVLKEIGQPEVELRHKKDAMSVCRSLFQWLLDNEMYLHAAALQWGPDVFQTEPESVVRSFEAMRKGSTILFMGASSTGKTYGAGAFMLLDYLRDPYFTTVKLAAINEDHLRKNLFAHIATLYRNLAIPVAYDIQVRDSDLWLGVKDAGYEFGISGIAFKQSQETSGQFKGYKAKPVRSKPHPKFGVMSRLRVLGDECFPYEQKIVMEDGSLIEIGKIVDGKVSGKVLSVNNLTGEIEAKDITGWRKVARRGRKIVSINGTRMTEDHPVLTRYGYVPALHAAKFDLEVYQHEDISQESIHNKESGIHNRRKPTWRRINLAEFWSSWKCQNKVRSRGFSARVSPVEAGYAYEFQSVGNQGSAHDGMGRGDVSLCDMQPPGIHINLPHDGSGWEKEGNEHSPKLSGPDGPCGLVHGRWGNISKWKHGIGKNINIRSSSARRGASCSENGIYGDKVQIVSNEKGSDHCNGGRGNEKHFLDDKSIYSSTAKIQSPWTEMPGEASRNTDAPWANDCQLLHLREYISENQKGENVLISMQSSSNETPRVESAQEGESVYCIDVADNHNFFAGSVCVKNCQNWPNGPFKDFNSLIASKTGSEIIKIACAFNPESTSQHVVQLAEPEHGWTLEDMETLYDYEAKSGWLVCRLDAARCENVIQKKVVFPGLQTYEGFISYLKSGGDSSANYATFARGFPPMRSSINTIIPPTWPQEARGEATFIEVPVTCAAIDLAFMGKDSAQMAVGRWGLASGWRDNNNKFIPFMDRLNVAKEKPRHVLQIDQILPMQKHDDTVKMAEEIIGRCKNMQIKPEWVAVDKTGYGFGTWSHLQKVWGPVLGIAWNEKATERKILAEDQMGADKQVDGLMSEMWWAFRRWLDPTCAAILINKIIPPQPIHTQLTSRRYKNGKNGIKVEPKEEYVSRNKSSPDEADSIIMLCHVVRVSSDVVPGLVEQQAPSKASNSTQGKVKFLTHKQMSESIETDDYQGPDNQD